MVGIIPQCHAFLSKHAVGKWYESYRFKSKETDDYLYPIQRGMLLLRVETENKRAFYWIYKLEDAIGLNEFVGLKMKAECHEIIISSRCRLFYDIDLPLDEFQQSEFAENYGYVLVESNQQSVMEHVSKHLAMVFKDATMLSLEEHGVDPDITIDWMWTMRNRPVKQDVYKISIHLVSNLMIPLRACSAIASDVKRDILFNNEMFLDITDVMAEALAKSIDELQYRRHGSLSLPFGTKHGEYTNWIVDEFNIPGQRYFITSQDQFSIVDLDISGYNVLDETSNYNSVEACPAFVKEALAHVHRVKDFDPRVWDINASVLKGSTMYVKRYAPSMCSICARVHDNDNTLFLIFNSLSNKASWKCARMPSMKPIVFYAREYSSRNEEPIKTDIMAFSMNYSKLTYPKHVVDDFLVTTGEDGYPSDDASISPSKKKAREIQIKSQRVASTREEPEPEAELDSYPDEED